MQQLRKVLQLMPLVSGTEYTMFKLKIYSLGSLTRLMFGEKQQVDVDFVNSPDFIFQNLLRDI